MALPTDQSSVNYLDTTSVVVEKPARFIEVERNQVIEEIQPVIYKETVVPTLIQETKPVYQKIVEGPTYIQETMPARNISGSGYSYDQNNNFNQQNNFNQVPQQSNFGGQQQAYMVEPIATGMRETPVLIETPTEIIPAVIEEPVVLERVTPIPPPAPLMNNNNNNKKRFHLPHFGKKHNKTVETTTTTVTTTDRPALAVTNELLYADGVSGANTILDGADPFNRDYLLADNPITHNEFARQPRDHHLPLTTAGPYLTSEPSIGGSHSRLVTPLGNGGDHYVDPARNAKLASKSGNVLNSNSTTTTQNSQVNRI